jgi:hypothetical protein
MALLRWLWPVKMLFIMPWSMLGIVPLIAGLLSGLFGVYQFRGAGTNIRPFREADTSEDRPAVGPSQQHRPDDGQVRARLSW